MVRVESTQGSVPRETGSWMAVFAEALIGTVGDWHLEYSAVAKARAAAGGAVWRWPCGACAGAGAVAVAVEAQLLQVIGRTLSAFESISQRERRVSGKTLA